MFAQICTKILLLHTETTENIFRGPKIWSERLSGNSQSKKEHTFLSISGGIHFLSSKSSTTIYELMVIFALFIQNRWTLGSQRGQGRHRPFIPLCLVLIKLIFVLKLLIPTKRKSFWPSVGPVIAFILNILSTFLIYCSSYCSI